MNKRTHEIKKRLAQRKRKLQSITKKKKVVTSHGEPMSYDTVHPLFNKDVFVIKIFAAIILFLVVGILFKNEAPQYKETRQFVGQVFEKEFQFATVATWYESKFGKPLALLPSSKSFLSGEPDGETMTAAKGMRYAIPASGSKVVTSFNNDGRGLMIETGESSQVGAVKEGIVIFIGDRTDIGKTVIIDHPGGGQTWYGMLKDVNVNLYDYVKTGSVVGNVSEGENAKGEFYFAIKQEDTFIDPIQVISFE